jgi:glutathione S-transferase
MASACTFSPPAVLHYFDGRGRAEPIRWMLEETGTSYIENVIKCKDDMSRLRGSGKLMYNQVPMLEIDGLSIVQTDAILRYLARKHQMLGHDLGESVSSQYFVCVCVCVYACMYIYVYMQYRYQ